MKTPAVLHFALTTGKSEAHVKERICALGCLNKLIADLCGSDVGAQASLSQFVNREPNALDTINQVRIDAGLAPFPARYKD